MQKLLFRLSLLALPALHGCAPVAVGTAMGTGVLVAEDRRTSGTYLEDQEIQIKSEARIKEKFGDQAHVNVGSFNRRTLVTGEAGSEKIKSDIENIVRAVQNVTAVQNEIAVAGNSSLTSRSNDTFITSKVKARMVDASKFKPNVVKVVTENGVVYLMGLVTKQEAADAADIAATTSGVQRVIKVFEYLD